MAGASRRGLTLVAALALGGCAAGDAYTAPGFPFAPAYKGAPGGAPVLLSNDAWWQRLDDPVLDRLVGLALRDSVSIAIARERVTEAQALLAAVPGALTVAPSVSAQRSDGPGQARPVTAGAARLGLTWMLDPYGARRATLEAAGAQVEVADAEADAAQLLVLLNVANAYLDLRYQQRILALSRQEVGNGRRTLELTRTLLGASAATRLDVARAEARVASIQSQLPVLEARVAAQVNQLAVLAGTAPGTLPVDLATPAAQPRADLPPDMGIPADLLRNRPDIRIAERRYYAAVADLGAARAALYPSLSLTGAITLNLLRGGRTAGEYILGPEVQFPALPTGATRAGVQARESRVVQAHAEWRRTVLDAIVEVENALLDYQGVTASVQSAARAARLYREARDLRRTQFENGSATLGDLIDAENELSQAERALAEANYRRSLGFVALNVRLGSGNSAAAQDGRSVN